MIRKRQFLESLDFTQRNVPSPFPWKKGSIDSRIKGVRFISYRNTDGIDYNFENLAVSSGSKSQVKGQFCDDFLGEPFEEIVDRCSKSGLLFNGDEVLCPCARYASGEIIYEVDTLTINSSVLVANGNIRIEAHLIELKNVLVKSPLGLKIRPKSEDSWFKEISIYPNKFIYQSLRTGETRQSETCCLSGTINLKEGDVDLQVLSGYMTVSFVPSRLDESLPYRIDTPQSEIQKLILRKTLEMEQIHLEEGRKEYLAEAVLTTNLFFQTKNESYSFMALVMFERLTEGDPEQERRGIAFHNMGVISVEIKKYRKALEYFESAKTLGIKSSSQSIEETKRQISAEVYTEGLAYRDDPQDTDHTKAIECFKEAIELDEKNVKAMHNVAMLYWKLKDYKGAELWFIKAAALNFEPSRRNLVKMQEEEKI